jgi:Beta-lactamase class C and other penicillin binding proteins
MVFLKRTVCFLMMVCLLAACSKSGGDSTAPPPPDNGTDKVDKLVSSFMGKNNVAGVSLAITRNGKLVYARGYGFADKQTGDRVDTSTLFRISSISKTVTATAIMKLLEENKLSLDDKIFGDDGILGNEFGTQPYKKYITDLTVKHCISHHLGGWGNASNDPTMVNQSMDAPTLISWILNNRPLDLPPGSAYAYSNVGFMILGRVIEKISGLTYEQYVRQNILIPAGINNMQIGGNTLADRKPQESKYHGTGSEDPYGYNFVRRDANGGWIASAIDMARLLVRIDGFPTVPDLLAPATMQTMTTPPFAYRNYACGVTISGSTWSHSGSFPGSRSHWMRTSNGFCGVIFANGSVSGLDDLLEEIINTPGISWPEKDIFSK